MLLNRININGLISLLKSKRLSGVMLGEVLPFIFTGEKGRLSLKLLKGVNFELFCDSSILYTGSADIFYSSELSGDGPYLMFQLQQLPARIERRLNSGSTYMFNIGSLLYFESRICSLEKFYNRVEKASYSTLLIEISQVVTGISSRLYKRLDLELQLDF